MNDRRWLGMFHVRAESNPKVRHPATGNDMSVI